jgi:starch synthase
LADTVTDSLPDTLALGSASGLVFNEASAGSLLEAIKRALILYNVPSAWKKMQINAMSKDFSWQRSAEQYLALYEKL